MSSDERSVCTGPGWRVALVLLLILVLGTPSLVYPFGRDQGAFATVATEALRGRVIYRDIFNDKPPLTHGLHIMALLAFGRSMLAIRLWDLLWQAATVLVVMVVARRVTGKAYAGVLAGGLYGLWYYSFDFWNTAQTDGWQTLPAALGVLAFLYARERERPWAYAASGVAVGIAALFKYPIGLLLPLLMLLVLADRRAHGIPAVVAMGLGFCLSLTLCAAVMAVEGSLAPFVSSQIAYITDYTYGRGGTMGYLGMVRFIALRFSWPTIALWLSMACAVGAAVYARRRGGMGDLLPVLAWAAAAAVSYLSQAKGFAYHGLPLLAPAAILGAYAVCAALDREGMPKGTHLALVALAELALLIPLVLYGMRARQTASHRALADLVLGRRTLQEVYRDPAVGHSAEPGFSIVAQMDAAEYIAARSDPDDRVFIWGYEPTIYFLSERRPASRVIYNHLLYGDWSWPYLREELLVDLVRNRPLYVVVMRDDALPLVTGTRDDSAAALKKFPALDQFLAWNYELEREIENMALYRRLGGES